MATVPFIGVGFLLVNDILSDISLKLLEPTVSTSFPANILAGNQTILAWDNSIYVGAQLLVGVVGTNAEVVTVTAVNSGVSFTAVFVNSHVLGEPIVGATFPVQNTAGDPFFTQLEMLTYLSNAFNDFLSRVPLVYNLSEDVVFGPSEAIVALPSDCLVPVRVAAFGIALRETSQSNLDSVDYRWQSQAASEPYTYYRDKIGVQNIGIWPRANNTTPLEVVYRQRGAQLLGLGDGFLLPDPFIPIIKHKVLATAYSKDGEQRAPAVAKFWESRYETGVAIANMILGVIQDTTDQ